MKNFRKTVFFIITVFLFISLSKNLLDYRKKVSFYQTFKKDYETEKQNNIAFKTKALKNSDSYEVEKTLRDKLNLAKKGEVTVLIPSPTPVPVKISPTPAPNYLQWWHTFFKED